MKIIDVGEENFEKEVLKSDIPVLVDFNASWCGPCRMMRPVLDSIAEEHENFKIVSLDIDENEELAEIYGVSSIPCLVLFDKGKEKNRSVGFIREDEVLKFLGEK